MQEIKVYSGSKSSRKVRVTYPDLPGFKLEMDFSPLIKFFDISGKFCLLHWQAMPKSRRRWGIWCESTGNYHSFDYRLEVDIPSELLQMPESGSIKPTAMILYRNAIAVAGENNRVRIDNATS